MNAKKIAVVVAVFVVFATFAGTAVAQRKYDYLGRPVRIGGYPDNDAENLLQGTRDMINNMNYDSAVDQLVWNPSSSSYYAPYLGSYGQLYPYNGSYYFGGNEGSYYGPYDRSGRSSGRVSSWIRTIGGLASIGLLAAGQRDASLYTSFGTQSAGGIADLMGARRGNYEPMPMRGPAMGPRVYAESASGQPEQEGSVFIIENGTKFSGELFDGEQRIGPVAPKERIRVGVPANRYRLQILVPEESGSVARKDATTVVSDTGWRFIYTAR